MEPQAGSRIPWRAVESLENLYDLYVATIPCHPDHPLSLKGNNALLKVNGMEWSSLVYNEETQEDF